MANSFPYQHINPRSLLDAIGGDRDTFTHLIGMFLRGTPKSRDALAAAIAADERDKARRLAHEIRGNVVIFGGSSLAGALAALEQALHQGPAPAEQAAGALAMIDATLAEMKRALDDDAATRSD